MAGEGERHSWITGFYWTLTVMSTLGFGDITFQGYVGRVFSIVVLLSGVVFLLIVLPFAFIQFFYAPWLEAQSRARAPREVPEGTKGHVILSHYDPVAISLTQRLSYHDHPYFVIERAWSGRRSCTTRGCAWSWGSATRSRRTSAWRRAKPRFWWPPATIT
jgi:voltage-gated potassium channel